MYHSDPPAWGETASTMTVAVEKWCGRTQAKVELRWAGGRLTGTGVAFRHPADCLTDEIGRKVATARALTDLADRLLAVSPHGDRGVKPLTLVR